MEETRGLYEFESDDADSGEFTYFYLAPDTNDTTYHIEFRYGSDADALEKYDAGDYAYWLASGISTEYDEKMVDDCIQLFCGGGNGGFQLVELALAFFQLYLRLQLPQVQLRGGAGRRQPLPVLPGVCRAGGSGPLWQRGQRRVPRPV